MQKKNPLLIVLAVCGGCLLVGLVVGGILIGVGVHNGKGLLKGFGNMTHNMPAFMLDIQGKNYDAAAALMDPSVSSTYTAAKIQHMEEAVEKKLGPIQGFAPAPAMVGSDAKTDNPAAGTTVMYEYQYTVNYQRGTAKANLRFSLNNNSTSSGFITGFTLEPSGP